MVKKILLCLLVFLWIRVLDAQTLEMKVATFNIRYDNPEDDPNTWDNRKDVVANLILFHGFDIFGIQEGLSHQVSDLDERLPDHDYVGVGRDDGKLIGEYTAIFYHKDKYKILDSETFWLAVDPGFPNVGWDAALPRICTWAKMEEINSKEKFYVFNTHFDHIGTEARKQSAALIIKKINEIVEKDTPVILTGDFNVDHHNESYQMLKNSENLKDTYETAEIVYANNGTTNGFDITQSRNRFIDHIFVSKKIDVKRYGVLTDTYHNRFPSDHFPVMAEISW
ncbi:MAG: endonuclease/exonuclease/phosphatase family protein [Cyclobacteriaceae bacterium]